MMGEEKVKMAAVVERTKMVEAERAKMVEAERVERVPKEGRGN